MNNPFKQFAAHFDCWRPAHPARSVRAKVPGVLGSMALAFIVWGSTGIVQAKPVQTVPEINTTQQPASAVVGSSIADQATVSGNSIPAVTFNLGIPPTGTVTFNLYNNATGTGTPLFTDTETLSDGTTTSSGYTTTATGTYYWVATYSGDTNYLAITSGTASEPVDISPATTAINTTQQPVVTSIGSLIADQATISGGFNPTGTVTFNLYNNPGGFGGPLFTDTETLSGGTATSQGYTPASTGIFYWVDVYNGDANNNAVTGGTTSEPVTVHPAIPLINTTPQPASAAVGSSIADQATLSGGFNPTGTVTFTLYNNPNGTGLQLFTDTETLSGGTATSSGYTVTATGTVYWQVTYNGDGNNLAVTSHALSEPVAIGAVPVINTTPQPASATVGTSLADQATVSGEPTPTGTVTFNLYNNSTGTGTPLFTDTETLSGGTATSSGYITTATGTDYWVATYSGDTNYIAITSGTAAEPVVVDCATISINPADNLPDATNGVALSDAISPVGGAGPYSLSLVSGALPPGVSPQATFAPASGLITLVDFAGTNGISPVAPLTVGPDGKLYGTAEYSQSEGSDGTIFKMTTNGVLTTLVTFNATDGANPGAGLTLGPDGNFYGTTEYGGTNDPDDGGDGTVFQMTTNGVLTTLVSFNGTDGANPYAGLTLGSDGNLYGTTAYGGTNGGNGTVFRVTTNGVLTILVSFNSTNGANPYAGVIQSPDGDFYGTTAYGGTNNVDGGGNGTVFQMTTNGLLTTLVSFNGTDGANPVAGLTMGPDGNFYGTTSEGGTNDATSNGTVFQMTTNGLLTTLVNFNGTDGANPQAGLTLGPDGNLYGTTYIGGTNDIDNGGDGTVFQMTTNGTLTTLVSFNYTNGNGPEAALTLGPNGNFYGTTANGGTNGISGGDNGGGDGGGDGTVFELAGAYRLAGIPAQMGQFTFTLQATDANGCSDNQQLTLNVDGLAIASQPQSVTNLVGTAASFSLSVTSYPAATFQWYFNGAPISGATATNYNLTDVSAINAGLYTLVASNLTGSVTSSPALLTVLPIPAIVTWTNPAAIIYGTALGTNQLDATASGLALAEPLKPTLKSPAPLYKPTGLIGLSGTFTYSPTNGVVLNAGTNTLSTVFTPDDLADYSSVTSAVQIVVEPAPLTVTAANASRAYGLANPLFTGTITGLTNGDAITVFFTSAAGAATPAGVYSNSIVPELFDPADQETNYVVTLVSGTLTITQATPIINWTNPAAILYGTALGTNQLNATASTLAPVEEPKIPEVPTSLAGTFAYTPASGVVLNTGTNTLSTVFTPADAADYNSVTNTVQIVVHPTPLTVTAANVSRVYGVANPGFTGTITGLTNGDAITATYASKTGITTTAGVYSNSIIPALVDPADRETNYVVTLVAGTLTITQATPAITWANPAAIVYGTALRTNQLDATAGVAGAFAYSPTNGVVLNAGTHLLSTIFTPTDTADYTSVTSSVPIVVTLAPLTVTAANASRAYGVANPLFTGTIDGLTNGDAITAIFTSGTGAATPAGVYSNSITPVLVDPADQETNYLVTLLSGTLTITPAAPIITWTNPAAILYGTALGTNQLNATASTLAPVEEPRIPGETPTTLAGTFAYTPASGVVLNTGTNTLSTVFTPADAADYNSVTSAVQIVVTRAPLMVTAASASRVYGAANPVFTGTITGLTNGDAITATFASTAGATTKVGIYSNSIVPALVDPANRETNYAVALVAGTLTVTPATPVITWANPAAIVYGTALGTSQLDATASVPGTFAYSPTNGVVLNAGTNTLSAIFTPTDLVDYTSVTSAVQIVVQPGSQLAAGASAPVLNNLTGLYEENVKITNAGVTISGLDLLVSNLTARVSLYNVAGTNHGLPYAQFATPLAAGATATYVLEFSNPYRLAFSNTVYAVAVTPAALNVAGATNVPIFEEEIYAAVANQPRFTLVFATTIGKPYEVIYSSDLTTWYLANPLTAGATYTFWQDPAPPAAVSRYYRVIQPPTSP